MRHHQKQTQLIFIYLLFLLFVITSFSWACYRVIEQNSASVTVRCDNGNICSILKIGQGWYWDGIRFKNFQAAAGKACHCE
jgi:hypothetical protein